MRREAILSVAGFATLSVVWGTQFLVIREGQLTMPPLLTVALRFAILGGCGAAAVHWTGSTAPAGTVRVRAAFGLAQAVSFALLYTAQQHIGSALVGLLSATTPLFVAVLAHVFVRGERLHPPVVFALALGFGGVGAMMISSRAWGAPSATLAVVLVLVGELAGATNKVLGKELIARIPAPVLLRDMGATVAVVSAAGWLVLERGRSIELSARGVLAFSYLGVVASFGGSALYMRLLRVLPVTTLGYLQFATALVASLTGVLLGGEEVTPGAVVAGVGILTGLAVLARSRRSA